jgi:hypothetical protein
VENICRSKSSKQFSSKVPNIWNNLSDPPHGDCIVEETKTDVELRALLEELSNSLV